ncbi:MAG TPA: hypothetical protein VJ385_19820 [Fibrobacteria bacterium]|nr:hypothetical protein [Fibrobacteria bacterium]
MPMFHRFRPFLLAAALCLSPASFAESGRAAPSRSHAHLYVAGAGLLLLAGGGAFAYSQNREADRDMALYRKSAFTGNTAVLRENVEKHQRLTWAGLAGAALGGILVVVSF